MITKTFTKKAVKALLICGSIGGMLPFLLSLLGRDPVTELGIAWITSVVATTIGYLMKAYFETKQQKKQELEDFLGGMNIDE